LCNSDGGSCNVLALCLAVESVGRVAEFSLFDFNANAAAFTVIAFDATCESVIRTTAFMYNVFGTDSESDIRSASAAARVADIHPARDPLAAVVAIDIRAAAFGYPCRIPCF
jgi:hypothetical protein